MDLKSRIFVAGSRGLVGSAITRALKARGFENLLTPVREEVNLFDRESVNQFFDRERPEYVFLAAAKVGGIYANDTYPADFLRDNLLIELNVIDAAYHYGVTKLEFLGSTCIYPKFAEQPIHESSLLTGALEPTNEAYAIAKIAGIKLCQAYSKQYGFRAISLMPTNIYGPGDNFDLANSHVLPALIRKFHEAKVNGSPTVPIWGSGTPRREFLYSEDLADACVFLMENYDDTEIVNVGFGDDLPISELAATVSRVIGFTGEIVYDATKPDGTPRKLISSDKLHSMGWKPKVSLEEGIALTYASYLAKL